MSIYEILGHPIPLLAVTSFQQLAPGVSARSHLRALQNAVARMQDQSNHINARWQEHLNDLTAKSVQAMRGNLLQFLAMPLQSDLKEIQRIMGDQVVHVSEQLLPKVKYGLTAFRLSRIAADLSASPALGRLVTRARTHMKLRGFKLGKAQPDIIVEDLIVHGGANLDILAQIDEALSTEHTHTPAQPLTFLTNLFRSVESLVFSTSSAVTSHLKHEYRMAVELNDADRLAQLQALEAGVRAAAERHKISDCSMWRNRLMPNEMTVSIRDNDRGRGREMLVELTEKSGEEVRDLVKTTGRLLVLDSAVTDEAADAQPQQPERV